MDGVSKSEGGKEVRKPRLGDVIDHIQIEIYPDFRKASASYLRENGNCHACLLTRNFRLLIGGRKHAWMREAAHCSHDASDSVGFYLQYGRLIFSYDEDTAMRDLADLLSIEVPTPDEYGTFRRDMGERILALLKK